MRNRKTISIPGDVHKRLALHKLENDEYLALYDVIDDYVPEPEYDE